VAAEPVRTLIPLPEEKAGLLFRLVEGLDNSALHWLSGYAAGLAAQPLLPAREGAAVALIESLPQQRMTIVYGSQTGNARRTAESLARDAEAVGLNVRLVRADAYPLRELKNERLLYVVISTQGDGDPPDDSRSLVEFLRSKRAPRLEALEFAVLGLGDSSYPKFCAIAADLDARLAERGATRLLDRGEADLDIETVAQPWLQRALARARESLKPVGTLATVTPLRPGRITTTWNRERPFAAPVLVNQRISARGSDKDIRHLELSLAESGLSYEPGDALGVWPRNPSWLVAAVLEVLNLDAEAPVTHSQETLPLGEWLVGKRELTRLARPFVLTHGQRANNVELNQILGGDGSGRSAQLLSEYQVIDLLRAFPAAWTAQDLVASLRPLTPRLYSIASSQKVVESEAHLTVSVVDYSAFGLRHAGVASHFLANREPDARTPVFIEANERFRLPQDSTRDIIMIGPGTGVAPFRGFLQDRAATGARGKQWLFFGNPHFRSDFLYQTEWQQALKNGSLQRLDVAFSRDQSDKVYVQHCLRRRGRELYAWLEAGAHVYVCGDATRMAKDVDATLREIVATHGGTSAEDAEAYMSRLNQAGRYARDVY
jgi:sulfite reductase (NADPH) flavoprotein alpha-component